MRNRFGRGGRRGRRSAGGDARPAAIDAAAALERIVEVGAAGARSLEPLEEPGVPASFAALGLGEGADGPLLVGFSPQHGGDAVLAVVAAGLRLVEEQGFDGAWCALAPQWSAAARRRLGMLGELPQRLRAEAVSALGVDGGRVEPDRGAEPAVVPLAQAAASLADPAERELFLRAAASLEGLAAKHGGALRGVPGGAELVLLARRAARLQADDGVVLESFAPDRNVERLQAENLANQMDRLEGLLRKRLNDRRIRGSDEGLRAQLAGSLAAAAALRGARRWPWPAGDPEVLDLVGALPDGTPAVGAVRRQLGLVGLGAVLDALAALRPALPGLLADVGAPLRLTTPRLLLAAREFDPPVLRVLPVLAIGASTWDIASPRGRDPVLEPRSALAPSGALEPRRALEPRSAPAPARPPLPARPSAPRPEAPAPREPERAPEREVEAAFEREPQGAPERAPVSAPRSRFEEVSFFDLDDERGGDRDEGERSSGSRRRRRGRRRRGGRRPAESAAGDGEDAEADPASADAERRGRGRRGGGREERRREPESSDEDALDDLDLAQTLATLAGDVPDLDEAPEPDYEEEDDEEDEDEAPDAVRAADERQAEREARRRARLAKASPEPEPEAPARPTRRRAAIVAHADRDSVLAGLLLARDIRLLEGFWVYPQAELMTFFRSVATDLREETPICVVGFTASPARDTIQAASLYAGRLDWFDHHVWPPEDLEALGEAIGRERLVVHPGAGSSVPAVLAVRSRRSRFSDKLVELGTGCFSQHDFERWGRVWWQRLADVAARGGERRADLEPLLVGRPSELAREAARIEAPPPPPELAYVAERDFRLVHFGGHALVDVPVPAELDLHLCGRIARERYGASLSLCHRADEDLVVLGGDESRSRRGLDLERMVEHLAAKHVWIEALPTSDRVARVRVRDLPSRPERLEEVIREIAMGRSILEG